MGLLSDVTTAIRSAVEARAAVLADGISLSSLWAKTTPAGITVSDDVALNYSTMWACVGLISETVGSLPLNVYKRTPGGGREIQRDHPLQRLLHDAPNSEMTAMQGREACMMNLLLRGNGYWYIERNLRGDKVLALWPLRADRMTPERIGADHDNPRGQIVYHYDVDGKRVTYPASAILHIAGIGWDGVTGKAPLDVAREAVGLGLAAQEFGSRFFGAGTHPSAVIEHPGKLGEKAYANLKKSLEDKHAGLGKAHKLMLLEEGMKLHEVGVSPESAQFLETRKFQRSEIASIYRVPLVMVDSTASTAWGSGIEQLMIGFGTHCIRPWCVRWEQAANARLLTDKERAAGYYVGHVLDAIQRGDIKSRYGAYAIGRQWGWLSADDCRALENLNPLPDGDGKVYLNPLNMVPASMYASQQPAEPQQNGGKA